MATEITDISSTQFQNSPGRYLDESGKKPIYITKHGRISRVLIDAEEYERLRAIDAPKAMHPSELDDEMKAELEKGFQGPETPELDHLMD